MDLDRYSKWAEKELAWLRDRLLQEEPSALAKSYQSLGEAGVLRCRNEHAGLIAKYLHSSRSQRKKMEKALSPAEELHGFLLAATYEARCGAALLRYACHYGFSASYNPAHAFLLTQASAVAAELHRNFPTVWPFETDPDPANDD